jgi:hypothetical protein
MVFSAFNVDCCSWHFSERNLLATKSVFGIISLVQLQLEKVTGNCSSRNGCNLTVAGKKVLNVTGKRQLYKTTLINDCSFCLRIWSAARSNYSCLLHCWIATHIAFADAVAYSVCQDSKNENKRHCRHRSLTILMKSRLDHRHCCPVSHVIMSKSVDSSLVVSHYDSARIVITQQQPTARRRQQFCQRKHDHSVAIR